jgi:Mg-chelatase subunit ChlD
VGRLDADAVQAAVAKRPDAGVALLADLARATDPQLRAQARRLAGRLLPALARVGEPRRAGTRRMVARQGALEGDLDVERTLERSLGARPRDTRDLVARQFAGARRTVCLLVDRSGSMSGHAVGMAAVAAAAVVQAGGERLGVGVIAFAADPLVLSPVREPRSAEAVVDDLLSLRGHGTTDVARALRVAAVQLEPTAAGGRTALLLSDCLATVGADPLPAAGGLDCLHVLGPSAEPDAVAAGTALARRGGGQWLAATTVAELGHALRVVLG